MFQVGFLIVCLFVVVLFGGGGKGVFRQLFISINFYLM